MDNTNPLPSLPTEVWLQIGGLITRQKHKLTLLKVCRAWRSLFFQSAYRKLNVSGPHLARFVNAIQRNPEIASTVQDLHVNWWGTDFSKYPEGDYEPALIDDLVERLSQTPEESEQWKKDLRGENEDSWLGLLLASLENLVTLDLLHPGYGDARYLPKIIMRAGVKETTNRLAALQRLESVYIYMEDSKGYVYSTELFPFFYLPAIRRLQADTIIEPWEDRGEAEPKLPQGVSPIEVLKISGNARWGMEDYIASCTHLKHFTYQHSNQEKWGESYIGFRPKTLHKALVSQKHSLEVLHVDEGEFEEADYEDGEGDGILQNPDSWFGSLAEFTQLSDLRVRVSNILDFESGSGLRSSLAATLPSSLETLTLVDCYTEHLSPLPGTLNEIISYRAERFPKLKTIKITSNEYASGQGSGWRGGGLPSSFIEAFSSVKIACQNAGINFSLEHP